MTRRLLPLLGALVLVLLLSPPILAEIKDGCYIPTIFEGFTPRKVEPDLKPLVTLQPTPVPECVRSFTTLFSDTGCWMKRCPKWIGEFDPKTGREVELAGRTKRLLSQNVFGQDHAIELISAALRSKDSDRPLSMHIVGDNGTGKTLSATLLSKVIFQHDKTSGFLYIRGNSYISKEPADVHNFRKKLRDLVQMQLKQCPGSLIVVDELQSLHRNTIVAFDSFLDTTFISDHVESGGVDPRQATFVFVSDFGKEGTSLNDTPEQLVARAYAESSGIWKSGRTAALIQHIIPFMPASYVGAFELTSHLTKSLFTHPYWARTHLNLTEINFCESDETTSGLAKYIWNTMTNGISKLEQYRGIQKVFDEEVVQKALTTASQFKDKHKLWSIPKTNPATQITLDICTNGGRSAPTFNFELPWCRDIATAKKKATQKDEL